MQAINKGILEVNYHATKYGPTRIRKGKLPSRASG
jgi:hypothetical protein